MSARAKTPWQEATALGKRLRVIAEHGERPDDYLVSELAGTAWAHASWTHPDAGLIYSVTLQGDDAEWALTRYVPTAGGGESRGIAGGSMDANTAHMMVATAKSADARRLAAIHMLRHLALETGAPA